LDPSAGVVQPVVNTVPALLIEMPAGNPNPNAPQQVELVPQYNPDDGLPMQLDVPAVNLQVRCPLGDTKCSLGDAKSSLGDACRVAGPLLNATSKGRVNQSHSFDTLHPLSVWS
jgi:hypothetical protein